MTEASTVEFGPSGRVVITGDLTFASIPDLYHQAMSRLSSGEEVIDTIDLSGVTAVDSAGLALMLEWQAIQSSMGRAFQILNAPASLLSLARLCESIELLKMGGRSGTP
jgi:phospholipid transport system transporter-binding protein